MYASGDAQAIQYMTPSGFVPGLSCAAVRCSTEGCTGASGSDRSSQGPLGSQHSAAIFEVARQPREAREKPDCPSDTQGSTHSDKNFLPRRGTQLAQPSYLLRK